MPSGDLNPYDLTSIKGYPDALKVYRIARSKFWQCRYFVPGRGLIRKSTRCTEQGAAIEFAKDLYENILLEQRSGRLTSQASFASFAEKLMDRQESMVARGELDSRMVIEERAKLSRDVPVYRRILERYPDPGDFVFFNPIANRDYAARRMGEMFNEVLEACNLKKDRYGQDRSVYSLRHTALMFRILKGDSVDLALLAKNARTSVQMLEKFYLSDLTPQMGVRNLQSRRR